MISRSIMWTGGCRQGDVAVSRAVLKWRSRRHADQLEAAAETDRRLDWRNNPVECHLVLIGRSLSLARLRGHRNGYHKGGWNNQVMSLSLARLRGHRNGYHKGGWNNQVMSLSLARLRGHRNRYDLLAHYSTDK